MRARGGSFFGPAVTNLAPEGNTITCRIRPPTPRLPPPSLAYSSVPCDDGSSVMLYS